MRTPVSTADRCICPRSSRSPQPSSRPTGLRTGPVTVTSGSLDAIERLLRERTRVGDHVAVEDPTFPALLDLLASLGLTPAPFGVDDEGPRPESLERALGPRVPAVIVSSRAQNPTGATISERRAADLRRVLRARPEASLIEIDETAEVSGASLVTLTAGSGTLGRCQVHIEVAWPGSSRCRRRRATR